MRTQENPDTLIHMIMRIEMIWKIIDYIQLLLGSIGFIFISIMWVYGNLWIGKEKSELRYHLKKMLIFWCLCLLITFSTTIYDVIDNILNNV